MVNDIPQLLQNLENSPAVFRNLLAGIPVERRKERRQKNHWTIHEWAAHLADAQEMLIGRFRQLQEVDNPLILAHLLDFSQPNPHLLAQDLEDCLDTYAQKRQEMLALLRSFTPADWQRPGDHEEYEIFNAYILLRHVLLIDHVHFFNIEKLWLTKESYLK